MQFPDGEISYRILPRPHRDPALAGFRCGFRRRDLAVSRLVRRQYRGKAVHHPTLLAIERQLSGQRETVGLSSWRPRVLPALGETPEPQIYIHSIGIRRAHRGALTFDGKPLGHALLRETLSRIEQEHQDGLAPIIWALVARRNDRSNRMFANTGFVLVAPERMSRWRLPLWLFPRWSFAGDAIQIRGLPEDALMDHSV